jgi:hypothetical protein
VLEQVLSGEPTEICIEKIHDYLTTVGEKVKAGQVDVDEFIINKRLGKNPEDYPDAKNQPQVQVALRIKARGGSARVGDVMQYVFCLGPDGKTSRSAAADKAYTVDEIKKDPELRIGTSVSPRSETLRSLTAPFGRQTTSITSRRRSCLRSSACAIRLRAPTSPGWPSALASTQTGTRPRRPATSSATSRCSAPRSPTRSALPTRPSWTSAASVAARPTSLVASKTTW